MDATWLLDTLVKGFHYATYSTYIFFGAMGAVRVGKFFKDYRDSVQREQLFGGEDD